MVRLRPCMLIVCVLIVSGCAGPSGTPGDLRTIFDRARTWPACPTEDIVEVRRLILGELAGDDGRASIAGIRWTSKTEVVAYGKRHVFGREPHVVYFLLLKHKSRWRVARRLNVN